MHAVVLMQTLATRHECPVELLKVTSVGTMRQKMKETGKRLESFVKSMNIPFRFKIALVSHMRDTKKELFDIEADEAVAVNCSLLLRSMITHPDHLETLMTVIKYLNPCIVVVTEFEGKHNSISFSNRFIEALYFYGAFFDCFETCMDDQHEENRIKLERMYCGQGIRNMVVMEGHVRTCRHVEIGTWRAFFARLAEEELSHSLLYQANLILKQVDCWSSCTLEMNGKSLIVGWKGTPIHSLSAWKFR